MAAEKYGFRVALDHEFPEKWSPVVFPRLHQLGHFIQLAVRYIVWYMKMWLRGRRPFINQISQVTGLCGYGVPLGGIGGGTIGRSFRGDFRRLQLLPGLYEYATPAADQFIVTVRDDSGAVLRQQVMNPRAGPACGALSAWKWNFPADEANYRGLYPRAWTTYRLPEQQLLLTVTQISPVIPNNYRDSCLPCAVFVWTVENQSSSVLDVSITFTLQSKTGTSSSKEPVSTSQVCVDRQTEMCAVMIEKTLSGLPCRLMLAAYNQDGVETSCSCFDPLANGSDLWRQLAERGSLSYTPVDPAGDLAVAVSARCRVGANDSSQLKMALVWHTPDFKFPESGRVYQRYYTRWFKSDQEGAEDMAHYALSNYQRWEREIDAWQSPILNDSELPCWYKSALFNELYYISDGGGVWLRHPTEDDLDSDDCRRQYGRFAYLESHEYIMYNTYDVHFYASAALVHLWPKLQLSLQEDMAEFVFQEDIEPRTALFSGESMIRKVANTVPHDLGNPAEAPFEKLNSYQIHDISKWKDLNLKFVLQVYRDYRVTGDRQHLVRVWPACVAVMRYAETWDRDGDGMIENEGFPDQTYDTWTMKGVSAYCGGLWVAALFAMSELSQEMKSNEVHQRYRNMLSRAQTSLTKHLWTGSYYKFDSSGTDNGQSIMSDQLCGHWYLMASGVHVQQQIIPHTSTALCTIYDNNVLRFKGGRRGAVNGMYPNGTTNTYTMQSEEIWTGVTYALAATMIYEGMIEEGFRTAEGIYRTVYERIGQGYETPEALYAEKHYRAVGYMRPLSIWSMQEAWQSYKNTTSSVPVVADVAAE